MGNYIENKYFNYGFSHFPSYTFGPACHKHDGHQDPHPCVTDIHKIPAIKFLFISFKSFNILFHMDEFFFCTGKEQHPKK